MPLCIVYAMLFVNTVNTKIKAHNAFNAIYVNTVNTKNIHTFLPITFLTLIVPAYYFQASVKCRKAQKCLYLTLSIQCHMQLKLFMSLTAV